MSPGDMPGPRGAVRANSMPGTDPHQTPDPADEHASGAAGRRQLRHDLDRLYALSLDLLCISSADGYFKRVNPAVEAILGWTPQEFLAMPYLELVHPDDVEATRREVERQVVAGEPVMEFENRYRHKDGGWRLLSWRSVPAEGGLMYATARDVTERHQIDLERSHLAAIVSGSLDAIIARDTDGRIRTWNAGAERMFGYSAAEMIGRHDSVLYPDTEEAHGATQRLTALALRQVTGHFETRALTKDGTHLHVSISSFPVTGPGGESLGIAKIVRDISQRKKLEEELRRARDTAEAANRELEAFSYSVAHDLRSPLRGIDGFSEALLEDCAGQLDPEGRRYLGLIRQSAQHMGQLIDDLLTLSRVTLDSLHRERVDLSRLARASLLRLQKASPERAVDVRIEDGLRADGDPRLLGVLFDNLLDNAWKFTGRRNQARIEIGSLRENSRTVYFVRDNGAGFDPAYTHKLFGVFQRLHTASEFEGTGVGLATVQRIIGRHGGRIWAEGRIDAGATFYFTLNDTEQNNE